MAGSRWISRRQDSTASGQRRLNVLRILPENPAETPRPSHLNWDTSTKSPQPRHLNQATSTKIVQNLDSKMVLIIFASNDTRQPSAWRQTHEAQTGATCANKRTRRKQAKHVRTNATSANKREQAQTNARGTRREQAQTGANEAETVPKP